MKKVLIFTLTATLLLLATMNTLGAIHPSRELRILDWDFNSFVVYFANGAGIHEGWFTTEAPETYMLGAIDYFRRNPELRLLLLSKPPDLRRDQRLYLWGR